LKKLKIFIFALLIVLLFSGVKSGASSEFSILPGIEMPEGYKFAKGLDFNYGGEHFQILGIVRSDIDNWFDAFSEIMICREVDGVGEVLSSYDLESGTTSSPTAISIEYKNFTDNDGEVALIGVETFTGGNDPVISCGLIVYQFQKDGELKEVFKSLNGSPALKEITGDDDYEVVVYTEYWPSVFVHVDVIGYANEVYMWSDGSYILYNKPVPSLYEDLKKSSYETYKGLKSGEIKRDEHRNGIDIMVAVAEYLIACLKGGEEELLDEFWDSEGEYLEKTLPEELVKVIKTDFYTEEGREKFK
jgi:hypothetical protein